MMLFVDGGWDARLCRFGIHADAETLRATFVAVDEVVCFFNFVGGGVWLLGSYFLSMGAGLLSCVALAFVSAQRHLGRISSLLMK